MKIKNNQDIFDSRDYIRSIELMIALILNKMDDEEFIYQLTTGERKDFYTGLNELISSLDGTNDSTNSLESIYGHQEMVLIEPRFKRFIKMAKRAGHCKKITITSKELKLNNLSGILEVHRKGLAKVELTFTKDNISQKLKVVL